MKNEKSKTKQDDTAVREFTIDVELPNGNWAKFVYSTYELADGHYTQLAAQQVVGHYGIKRLTRSWKK
jgi:hypothetical protein